MTISSAVIFAGLGVLITWFCVPFIQSRLGFLNRRDAVQFHHSNDAPISRLGGVALAASFVIIASLAFLFYPDRVLGSGIRLVIFFTSLGMFGLGFWDDIRPLGAKRKLLLQILIATIACYFGIQIQTLRNPFDNVIYHLGFWGPFLTVCWMVALTNLINLIDGIDGLAGGVGLMLMGLLAYFGLGYDMTFPSLCAAGMFGALAGFLRFNFPPAKIYMGDGGAYFVGFLIAALSAVNSHKGTVITALIAPLFVLALPITDVCIAILRRGIQGLPLFRADRKHLHHRLVDMGISRTRVVLIFYSISLVFLLLALVVFWSGGRWIPSMFGLACAILLISARSFSFSREWFSIGRVLGNSLSGRKATQYALTLGRWLEMEAERCDSVESLWLDFRFLVMKLGYSGIKLSLEDGESEWKADVTTGSNVELHRRRQNLVLHRPMSLEFTANKEAMNLWLFDHLCDIASEAWHKSASLWCERNHLPLRFDSRSRTPEFNPARLEQHFFLRETGAVAAKLAAK